MNINGLNTNLPISPALRNSAAAPAELPSSTNEPQDTFTAATGPDGMWRPTVPIGRPRLETAATGPDGMWRPTVPIGRPRLETAAVGNDGMWKPVVPIGRLQAMTGDNSVGGGIIA